MKFGQLIEYNMKIFFFRNNAENEAGRLPILFLLYRKALNKIKASGQYLGFNIFC